MSTRLRLCLLGLGLAGLAAVYLWGLRGIPAAGGYPGPYGSVVNAVGQSERNVTDMVTAVNFDYRGFDTIGEEFILFVAVAGVAVVLRRTREEQAEEESDDDPARTGGGSLPPTSDAVRVGSLLLVGPTVLLGVYIVSHGQLSPGGGFQGGVILATALLLVFLGGRYRQMKRVGPASLAEVAEAAGAGGFALVGLAGLLSGAAFLADVLPLGWGSSLAAGGTIPVISACVGLEVAGGVVVILSDFLEQALEISDVEEGTR